MPEHHSLPREEAAANARLMAAAPDLLEACKAVVNCPYPTPDNLKDACRAAVDMAEGRLVTEGGTGTV